MAKRKAATSDERMTQLLRVIVKDVDKLNRGGAHKGQASFGTLIRIGAPDLLVDIEVTGTPGGAIDVTFRNVATLATFVINL